MIFSRYEKLKRINHILSFHNIHVNEKIKRKYLHDFSKIIILMDFILQCNIHCYL